MIATMVAMAAVQLAHLHPHCLSVNAKARLSLMFVILMNLIELAETRRDVLQHLRVNRIERCVT